MASHGNKSTRKHNVAAVLQDVLPALELSEHAKRVCDIVAAITGLVLLSPIFLITALAIKLESRGPIFVRVSGHNNQTIRLIKFRVAMRVGQILAQTGIDELPQFINVLRGEISILGRRNVYRWPRFALRCERHND